MKYGVQYYPEQWPEERWLIDADMMQQAGVNVVRMGEFAWGAYEPCEGEYDFSWMERAINLLGEHGVKTILCTCSRTPPPWVYKQYPEVLNSTPQGTPYPTDGRYQIGLSHPKFKKLAERIDEAVVRHFAGNPNIIAWQVDNEVGARTDCYCDVCKGAFHGYLEDKYTTPEALNEAWGKNFWSFGFNNFDEVPIPGTQPQLLLEYRRFMSHLNVAFTRQRADLIRKLDPGKPVTTNFQSVHAVHTDYYQMGKHLDVNGMNHYPSRSPELAIDYNRGGTGTIWILEQHTRLQPVDTPLGYMRLWAWMAIAHGADAIVFFRWRQCRWGQEQHADGLLPHSGQANRFYDDLAKMGAEIKTLEALLDATSPASQVALTYTFESRWAMEAGRFKKDMFPATEATGWHNQLARQVLSVDALDPRADLSQYKLVIAAHLWIVDDAISANLHSFVKNGGTLVLTPGSGVADEFGKSFLAPRPGPLHDIAGVMVSDLAMQADLHLPLSSNAIPGLNAGAGYLVADELHPEGAEVVVTYTSGWRKGLPAITLNQAGKGKVVYVGTMLDDAGRAAVIDWLLDLAGVARGFDMPDHISAYERQSEDIRLLFLLNRGEDAYTLNLGSEWEDALSGEKVTEADIPVADLRILKAAK